MPAVGRLVTALRVQWHAAPGQCACLLGLTVLTGASAPALAWILRGLLDAVSRDAETREIVTYAVELIGVQGLMTAGLHLTAYVTASAGQRLKVALADRLFVRVVGLPGLQPFEDPAFLDRLQLAEQGVERAAEIFVYVQDAVRGVVALVAFTVPMVAIWPPMAFLLLAAAMPAVAAQLSQSRRHAAVASVVVGTYRRQFFYRSLMTDAGAAKEMRLFGFGPHMHGRMVAALADASSAELAVERRGTILQALIGVVGAAVTGVGVLVVVVGAAHGRFSVGDVAFFLAAVAGLEATLAGLVGGAGHVSQHLFMFSRFLEVLETADDLVNGDRSPAALQRGIELDDVWFRYDEASEWVLRGVNLSIPRGSTVGVVGLNGAGKSTLVKLLCRFYDPQKGVVRWDGVDLREFDLAELRQRVGATFQDFVSYELTAAENIGLGDLNHVENQRSIRAAARLAEVDEVLSELPRGYDTMLSRTFADYEDAPGATLSGGQWQRVALARSVMRADADLLVLDEPSSGLDAQAEHRIHETIAGRGGGRTRLLISHRLAALRGADFIVVLSDGRVVEKGSHDELMVADGEYARLFTLQARDYQDERVLR
jgi:ATP-binding cassette subfamily B protein